MRRTERLFQIIQVLRSKRRPVTGRELADELEVSLRTLYRDIAELMAQRVPIRGEAGTGYVIDSGYDMPPLMLTQDELEAAVLGAAWVAERGDAALARGARDLIGKLTAAVPEHLRPVVLDAQLAPISFKERAADAFDLAAVRGAIREQRKMRIAYADENGRATERTIWPFMIGYFETVRIVVAWCELREAFRHFRSDRFCAANVLEARFRPRPAQLRKRWEKESRGRCNT
ncbi:MAG TPA: YafY family protein [Vitreimonas sp.]|uniref:helix-turn-helix transcriptional regulator n=1 Tax=Vitreimonas sp. TaxID=3069702 RepID=UPI002D40E8C9|nr:YafY family protein [Vitreimonas sp.]HYD87008.1 YafY family protein [Vitreimonas sp.]